MKYFGLIFLLSCSFLYCNANILQTKPASISEAQLKKLEEQWHTHFSWCWRSVRPNIDLAECSFCYEKQAASFALKICKIPVYWHKYRLIPNMQEVKDALFSPRYYFAHPLEHKDAMPKKATFEELASLVKHKKVVFYTGAGLSAQANVPTMSELEQSLEMRNGTLHLLKALIMRPGKMAEAFASFCRGAIYGEPTAAHRALTALAEKKQAAVITENVDLLQQRAGIAPLFSWSDELHSVTHKELQAVEVMICVGLSHDDRGLLAWYKHHNPQGIIVAIDFNKPSYLSNYDYLYQRDLQEALVMLEQAL